MALPSPEQIWKDCCEASRNIRARYGLKASIDYLVGDKLMLFAQTGESSPEFLAELPAFSKRIRKLFTKAQIEEHSERAAQASEVEPDIFKGATESHQHGEWKAVQLARGCPAPRPIPAAGGDRCIGVVGARSRYDGGVVN